MQQRCQELLQLELPQNEVIAECEDRLAACPDQRIFRDGNDISARPVRLVHKLNTHHIQYCLRLRLFFFFLFT